MTANAGRRKPPASRPQFAIESSDAYAEMRRQAGLHAERNIRPAQLSRYATPSAACFHVAAIGAGSYWAAMQYADQRPLHGTSSPMHDPDGGVPPLLSP